MMEYNRPSHGKLQKERRPTRRVTKRLQFKIHILQMENKFKKLILKLIKILRSMIWMIHRRMKLLHTFKEFFVQTSEEKITNNSSFERSPKLKSQAMSMAAFYKNIPPWKLFKKGRQT